MSNKNKKAIAYASSSLNKTEINYPTIQKELLAINWAVKYFRSYLYARRFKILTDHRPLVYLFSLTDPSSRLTKFRLRLEEYDFYVEYIKGSGDVTADVLSRINLNIDELKCINERAIAVMTRSQQKRVEEQERSARILSISGLINQILWNFLKNPKILLTS